MKRLSLSVIFLAAFCYAQSAWASIVCATVIGAAILAKEVSVDDAIRGLLSRPLREE